MTIHKKSNWDDLYWDEILFNIQEGNCILMVGPGASLEKQGSKFFSSGELLALELAKQSIIKEDIQKWKIDKTNLAQVSLAYTLQRKAGRSKLLQKVKSFYQARDKKTVEPYENLASLPFSLIISTSPDRMYSNALNKVGKEPYLEYYHFKGEEKDILYDYSSQKPLVFELYGSIDDTRSLILTEDDVLDFLVSITDKTPPLPSEILTQLRSEDKTLLFVGFGFQNWYLRILLRILQVENKESPSYALEHMNTDHVDQLFNVIIYYSHSNFKIQVCNYDIVNFTKELKSRFFKLYPQAPVPKPASSPSPSSSSSGNKAKIFISYAGEDEKLAKNIYSELLRIGCDPWWDRSNLRGGDDWDAMIEEKLNESDYMIIIVSDYLHKKISQKGYVVKEIQTAMEGKQKRTIPPEKFIIPVQVNGAKRLNYLKKIQSVVLTDTNIEPVVKVIQEDLKRRKDA